MNLRLAGITCLLALPLLAERSCQLFNADWQFRLDPEGALQASATESGGPAWRSVRLPHDWAISGPFAPDADGGTGKLPWRGVGWYRTAFTLPLTASAKRVYLDFDGVMASPEVFINGQKAGGWDYGYIGFRVDATPFVAFGKPTVLVVRADTRQHHSRWYPGAGIYRKVTLTLCDPVHVAHEATFITTPQVTAEQATVQVVSAIANETERAVDASVTLTLLDPSGKTVAEHRFAVAVQAGANTPLNHPFKVDAPHRWDMATPHLYLARIAVKANAFTDTESTRFGIRSFSFPADDGFHLNGRRVQLNGVNLHADLGPLGMAFNRSAMRRQLEILRDMGANALRTSHNCPAPEVLELCDEMGIFVWNECFDKWEGTSGRRPDQNVEDYVSRNLRQFVRRDRNHPCVFIWSIGNEIPPAKPGDAKDPGMTEARCTLFREVIRNLDTTRPVGIGCCHGNAIGMGIFANLDLTGWNYGGQYANIKRAYPDKPALYSESASALSSYGYYALPQPQHKTDYAVKDLEVCSYDHNAAPWSDIPDLEFARMARDRYCGGEFVWTGFDYLGEPTPYMHYFEQMRKYPQKEMARSSYFGIVDLCGVPKDRFYLYRSHWNTADTTLHLLPHWNWTGKEGQNVPVYVYTSGDSAELFLNGQSLGRRTKGQQQPKPANLAAGKPASASSVETALHNNPAAHAVDGSSETRWCASGPEKAQWWQVDLGAPTAFRFLSANFEGEASSYQYEILTSDDGAAWSPYAARKLGAKERAVFAEPATCRYVRVSFSGLAKNRWASIRAFTLSNEAIAPSNPYYDVCDTYRLRWLEVPYEPGELKAVAYKNGATIAERVMKTAGKPVAVRLTPEPTALPADGESVVFVQVDVTDAAGTRDPRATHLIRFSLTGPGEIVAVGNGNPRGLDAFTDTACHPLYFGKAVAVLRRKAGQTGPITLTASADGLAPASFSFK
jgi:beta-galactosidase